VTFESVANTIRSRFKAQIADVYSLPTQYDNAGLDRPHALHGRLTIHWGDTEQVSLGAPASRRFRTVGVMTVSLFVPVEYGDQPALEAADRITTAFRGVEASNVHFGTPSIVRVGRSESTWQINVHCPFWADDLG